MWMVALLVLKMIDLCEQWPETGITNQAHVNEYQEVDRGQRAEDLTGVSSV